MTRTRRPLGLHRRALLKGVGASCAGLTIADLLRAPPARAQSASMVPDRLLFVVAAAGGGSILESLLPVADTQVSSPELAATLAVQPSSQVVQVGGIRCVRNAGGTVAELPAGYQIEQYEFLTTHGADTVVMTTEGTSVNHRVAQKRSLTGASKNRGRTLMEAVAAHHGQGLLLPNINMAADGYLEPGDDPDLEGYALPEPVADAKLFALQTDGRRGLGLQTPVSDQQLTQARALRAELDEASVFGRTFASAHLREAYLEKRAQLPALEARDLITELMMVADDDFQYPLGDYGLESSPVAESVRAVFSDLETDAFQAQAALGFLLARAGVSCAVTISPSFQPLIRGASLRNAPLAFDFSHADHRGTQNLMWSRCLSVVDGLVRLLKNEPIGDGGETMWDRSLIYVATDFGRDKIRPAYAQTWGTAHHLNNGVVMLSPLLVGDRVYGGVDPETLLTYGFDRQTGEPLPGEKMREGDVYSVICQALGVPFDGRQDIPAMVRGG